MSRQAILLMASGSDRPGIVDRISGAIFDAQCNLEDSCMAILGGEFALIVLVTGTAESLEAARENVESVAQDLGLTLQVKSTDPSHAVEDVLPYRLNAVAMDHPGIVHRVTRFLKDRAVNVVRLDTRVGHAPTTGTPLFTLEMEIHVPTAQSVSRLRADLADLAEESHIDISLSSVR